jgi:hypothetical protein
MYEGTLIHICYHLLVNKTINFQLNAVRLDRRSESLLYIHQRPSFEGILHLLNVKGSAGLLSRLGVLLM